MTGGQRIANIQLLRGIAALMVVGEHVKNAIFSIYLKADPAASWVANVPLAAGVDIFFVISGFVMAYSTEALHGSPGAWRGFIWRRVIRIAPLYWLATAALILFFVLTRNPQLFEASWWSVVGSLLFIPTLNTAGQPLPIYSVGWTLNHEMFFYAVFAAFVALPAARGRLAISATLLALIGAGLILDTGLVVLDVWTAPIMLEFVLGVGLYELHRRGRIPTGGWMRLAALAAASAMLFGFGAPGEARAVLWGIPAALIVLVALGAAPIRRRDIAEFMGDISYAAYLLHILVILLLASAFNRLLPASDALWFLVFPLAVFVATIAVAALSHRYIERPTLRLLSRTGRISPESGAGPLGAAPAG